MRFDLERIRAVLAVLGQPQNRFVSVHVAGTNGKGSVCAMVERILREAGYKTALYTSPHLERLTERFRINGREMAAGDLDACVKRLRAALASPELRRSQVFRGRTRILTQFEALTVVAFLWFAENKPDLAVVETGLGGRLDATNILSRVAVSVITTIGLDHTDWLGSTPVAIAREKGGIIKPGVPVVTGASGPSAAVLRRMAREKGASIALIPPPVRGEPRPALAGRHQVHNAAVAAGAARALRSRGFRIPDRAVRAGLARAEWPGRFERFLVRRGKTRIAVILDGAHNPDGVRALVQTLREQRLWPVDLLFGALQDKDIEGMVKILAPSVRRCVTVPVPSGRSASPSWIARRPSWQGKARAVPTIQKGWRAVLDENAGQTIVVAGSLYLVGAVRPLLKRNAG